MHNPTSSISLIADDIKSQEFVKFIEKHPLSKSLTFKHQKLENEGNRGVMDWLIIILSSDIGKDFVVAFLYDLIKFGINRLKGIFNAKPLAIIILKNGKEIKLPKTMAEEEIKAELHDCIDKGIKSLKFDR